MKKFQNYTFEFDKNEKKIIETFCKQAVGQMQGTGDSRFSGDIKALNSILDKLQEGETVKFTKEEKTRLVRHLSENRNHIEQQIDKSWFVKKWLYRSMLKQYNYILEKLTGE